MAEDCLSDSSSADSHPPQTRGRSSRSSASLGCVADLVFRYLPVRTLVQLKVVSKEWRAWCDENLLQIAKERRKDESKSDWYFPLAFVNNRRQRGNLPRSWKWYGIHQGTKEQHTLPGLDFLPYYSQRNGAPCAPRFYYTVEAGSSGLLVLSKSSGQLDNCDLIVCNPLSKKWKRLPGHGDCQDRWMQHTHLVLGDLPNEYRVIRVCSDCIKVYSSSTERWVYAPYDRIGFVYLSSVCFEGHVYILQMMEVEVPLNLGTLRWRYNLQIYDIESGRYGTKTFTSSTVVPQDCNEKNELVDNEALGPILVVCMGNLYVVAASCRAGRNHAKPRQRHETYVANFEFHIFTLMEEGRLLDGSEWKHLVTVPLVLRSVKKDVVEFWEDCGNFNCVARSNMICLAWSSWKHRDAYLPVNYLEYDVVSGLHTTYTVGAHHRQPFCRGCNMAYTPCLDLEP